MLHKQNKQATSLQLAKGSTGKEMKTYFTRVFKLKQSGKEFPVNLEEVWPVVYGRKEEAIRALKSDFIEGEDYIVVNTQKSGNQFLRRNAEKSKGRPSICYYLSVPCLEYFIVKKVRPVFEVYRRVFHKVAEPVGGVLPILYNGVSGYPRKELLEAAGYSAGSGTVSALKRRYPEHFFRICRTACISKEFAKLRLEQGKNRQLEINFQTKKLKGGRYGTV